MSKLFESVYKKFSKEAYDKPLFDLADEMKAKELPGSGYVGISSKDDIDDEESIKWYYYDGSDPLDKDRWGGESVEWYGGLLYCDEFGNIAPPSKQKKRLNRKTGKEEVVGIGMQLDSSDQVLWVKEYVDLDYAHYEKLSKKQRDAGKARYLTHGPTGKGDGAKRRLEKRAAAKENADRIERWEKRGSMYSPWSKGAPKGWPEDFYEMVQEYTSFYNDGKITKEEIYDAAKAAGVDKDEVDQYISERNGAFSEAYANSIRSNN
jgi:hypothetical protein